MFQILLDQAVYSQHIHLQHKYSRTDSRNLNFDNKILFLGKEKFMNPPRQCIVVNPLLLTFAICSKTFTISGKVGFSLASLSLAIKL